MKSLYFFLLFLFAFYFTSSGQNNFFRHYSHEEGLKHPFVYSVNQDPNGFLWIGTGEGLYRFNGFEFDYFTTNDGLGDNFITRIYRDRAGKLWFGHPNGTISVRTGNDFLVLSDSTSSYGSITDIIEDDQGIIWATVQNQGLVTIDLSLEMNPVSFSLEMEPFSSIEYLGNEYFLIGSQENIYLARYEKDKRSMVVIKGMDEYPGSKVVDIIPASQGSYIVISQDDGFYSFEFDSLTSGFVFTLIEGNPDGYLDNLQGGILDSQGMLWLYSMGEGLIQYSGNISDGFIRAGTVSTVNGLVSDNIRSVFEDFEKNLWFGTFGDGLLRYVDNNLSFYLHGEEEGTDNIYAIAGDASGILAGMDDGLLKLNIGGDTVRQTFLFRGRYANDRVNATCLADDGSIWLGFEKTGLLVKGNEDRDFRSVFLSNDDLANSVNHIMVQKGYIWVGTKKGICRINKSTGNIKWFTTREGLPHNNIRQLFADSENRVLIATLCSEIHYINSEGQVGRIKNSGIGPFNQVVSITQNSEGILWAATQGNGVWKIAEGGNVNYTRAAGLLSDFCYGIILTEDGMPVVSHKGGLSRIDPVTNRIKTFSRLEGITGSAEFYPNAIFSDKSGFIWFGSSEGLVRYRSGLSEGDRMPPMLTVNSLRVDGEELDFDGGPVYLKAGQYELAVDYVGINFTNPELVIYRTWLEGYNKSWSELTSGRREVYDRIGHGNYTFKIRAFNENDMGSELSSAFELIIKKPLYLTLWFNAMLLLIISFIVYIIIRWRERNLRTEQERLLKNLNEKTKEIIVKEEIIKERKKVEKVLIEAKEKAELSEKLKSSFLQNMSHEIRTPMNAIVGFSSLLRNSGTTDPKQLGYLNIIDTNAESLLTLIDDILDVSQLESNQLKIKQGACKVNTLILSLQSRYLELMQIQEKSGIELIAVTPGEDDLQITTDPVRLRQVLVKLLDNALKFTEAGKITLGYEMDEDRIKFYIEDTGIGLSEDKAGVIFDLFRKAEDDKLKLYGGTGLGLTLARYLVQLLGGEIDVESKENVGSKFSFLLPLKSPPEDRGESTTEMLEKDFIGLWKGKNVLIVEDIDSNFLLIEEVLKPTGINIDRVGNGEAALEKYFSVGPYDFIIMDIKLPGMDGYQTTMKIREKDRKVPIISYTAYALEGDREKSLEAGCNEYFTKPADNLAMLNAISRLLN